MSFSGVGLPISKFPLPEPQNWDQVSMNNGIDTKKIWEAAVIQWYEETSRDPDIMLIKKRRIYKKKQAQTPIIIGPIRGQIGVALTVKADLLLPGTSVNICGRIVIARDSAFESIVVDVKNLLLELTLKPIRAYIDSLLTKKAALSSEEISEWVSRPTTDQIRVADELRHAYEIFKTAPSFDDLYPFSS